MRLCHPLARGCLRAAASQRGTLHYRRCRGRSRTRLYRRDMAMLVLADSAQGHDPEQEETKDPPAEAGGRSGGQQDASSPANTVVSGSGPWLSLLRGELGLD